MRLLAEAWRVAWAQRVTSLVTAAIATGVTTVILATTGQTVRAEEAVLAQIDDAGTRTIVVSDTDGTAGITADAVDRIEALAGVEWVIGLGGAVDGRNTAARFAGARVPYRALHGDLPTLVTRTDRDLAPGQVLAGPDARARLGLDVAPAGSVTLTDGRQLTVVGEFEAAEPLALLNGTLLGPSDDRAVRFIHVAAVRPDLVGVVADATEDVLGAANPEAVAVATSETLAGIRAAVAGELGTFGRALVAWSLAGGLVLIGFATYGSVAARRRDFGRRRALGASRPAIVGLVAAQTVLPAGVGAAAGAIGTTWYFGSVGPGGAWSFAAAVAVLCVLSALAAALPSAVVAAYRDPVRILRVP